LEIDHFDGTSWVGVVPFRMEGVSRRPLPDMPGLSAFPELNVRLYVTRDRRPGVWFLSLDATSAIAVWAARTFFHLPYHHAAIDIRPSGTGFRYRAERFGTDDTIRLDAEYAPVGPPSPAVPGSLEAFLTERYCLYTLDSVGSLLRCEVHHEPWPLQPAEGRVEADGLLAPHGLRVPDLPPLLHFARGVDVVVWSPRRV
jgi:uncharacterized protein YqjF (DUF2071 family)